MLESYGSSALDGITSIRAKQDRLRQLSLQISVKYSVLPTSLNLHLDPVDYAHPTEADEWTDTFNAEYQGARVILKRFRVYAMADSSLREISRLVREAYCC